MKTAAKVARGQGPAKHSLTYQFHEVIEARGLTAYAVGRLASVDPGVVSRFLNGQRDIQLKTADRIAAALGLRLVEVASKAKGRTRPPRAIGGDAPEAAPAPAADPDPGPAAGGDGPPGLTADV